ncbi:MAG: hypothetical protein RSE64_06115 [Oscillospiraceae bacterium]
MNKPSTLVCLLVFLLLARAILLISGLDKTIGLIFKKEQTKKEKAKALRMGKSAIITKLRNLNCKRELLIREVKLPLISYYIMTALGVVGGGVIGKVFFHETLFAVIVAILGAFAPILFLSIKYTKTKSSQIEKLQSSMMILSASYIVTEDFLKTVQDNIELLEYPEPFKDFLAYVNFIDGNVKAALRRMENGVGNVYFSQWVDVLIMAQEDRSLKYVTMSVMDAMNDVQQAQLEADTAIFAVWREYFTILMLIFSAPLIFRILMAPAYIVLVTSFVGRGLLLLLLATVVYSIISAVRLNKPLLM